MFTVSASFNCSPLHQILKTHTVTQLLSPTSLTTTQTTPHHSHTYIQFFVQLCWNPKNATEGPSKHMRPAIHHFAVSSPSTYRARGTGHLLQLTVQLSGNLERAAEASSSNIQNKSSDPSISSWLSCQPTNNTCARTHTHTEGISRLLRFLRQLRWKPDPSSGPPRTSWTVRGRSFLWDRSWTSSPRMPATSPDPVQSRGKRAAVMSAATWTGQEYLPGENFRTFVTPATLVQGKKSKQRQRPTGKPTRFFLLCGHFHTKLVSWCFEPSQPLGITSGLMSLKS